MKTKIKTSPPDQEQRPVDNLPPLARVRLKADASHALTAWSDAWVTTFTDNASAWEVECYLLSLLGTPAAVRGLQSAFLSHSELSVKPPNGEGVTICSYWNSTYRTRWSRLPSGCLHALLVADLGQAVSIGDICPQNRKIRCPPN